jgi:SAM-dependent methyltransferase
MVPLTIDELMQERFPAADQPTPMPTSSPDILIAGCGTGLQAILAAQTYRDANILAVDISATSLAYAQRKAEEAGISNVEFAQADILKLGSLTRTFDVIESVGVLHHLGDPYLGWSTLLKLLRPGGLMKVGLYSEIARAFIVAAQDFAKRGGYQPDPEGIRRCRQDILRLAADNAAAAAANLPDFFTASMFRDLVMHVAEHRMTLPAIRQFLDANNLNFIGFDTDDRIRREFVRRFPEPEARKDLTAWHAFEQDNPETFIAMYNFWIQKPA